MNFLLTGRCCLRRLISCNRLLHPNSYQKSCSSFVFNRIDHWRSFDQNFINGNSYYARNYLRTATSQIPVIPEINSSPIRNQTRLFAGVERSDATKKTDKAPIPAPVEEDDSKLTLAQRFKKMFKQYWYVVLPVHGITSCAWFGLFYAISASGLDVVGFLEYLHLPEVLMDRIRNTPQAGHFVVAFALYKLATPLRYMTTLGVTYYAVKTLSRLGYIKPMPNRKQLKAMYDEKRDQFKTRRHRWRQERRFLVFKKRHVPPTSQNGHHPKRTP